MTSKIDRYFLIAATAFALAGMIQGILMAKSGDFRLNSMHSHIDLVGWVTLALYGMAYRADFAAKDTLGLVHFLTALAGALLMAVGIYFADTQGEKGMAIAGSVLTLGSMVLFLVNVLRRR